MVLWELHTLQLLTLDMLAFQCQYMDGPLPLPIDLSESALQVENMDSKILKFRNQIEAGYRPPLPEPGTFTDCG